MWNMKSNMHIGTSVLKWIFILQRNKKMPEEACTMEFQSYSSGTQILRNNPGLTLTGMQPGVIYLVLFHLCNVEMLTQTTS